MKAKLMIGVMIGLLILSFLASSALAHGIEPSPFHTQVNKLNSAMNSLDSINRRLTRLADVLPPDPAKLKTPAPEGIIGMLEAMASQLHVSNDKIMNVLSGVPMKPEPLEIKIVLMDINREVMETVKLARMGIRYENEGVRNAFMNVEMAAEGIIVTVKDWVMNSIYIFEPNNQSCLIGYPCDIMWDTSNIQNFPYLWVEVVNANGSDCCGALPGIPNIGLYSGFVPDPSWADPGVLCQPFRIKLFVDPNTDDYSGVSGLFKVGLAPNGCPW